AAERHLEDDRLAVVLVLPVGREVGGELAVDVVDVAVRGERDDGRRGLLAVRRAGAARGGGDGRVGLRARRNREGEDGDGGDGEAPVPVIHARLLSFDRRAEETGVDTVSGGPVNRKASPPGLLVSGHPQRVLALVCRSPDATGQPTRGTILTPPASCQRTHVKSSFHAPSATSAGRSVRGAAAL